MSVSSRTKTKTQTLHCVVVVREGLSSTLAFFSALFVCVCVWSWAAGECGCSLVSVLVTHTHTNSTVSRKVSPPWGGQMLRHWLTQTLTFAWRSGKWSSGKLHRLWWRRYTQLLQSVDTCWGQKQVTETVRFCLWTVRVFPFQPSRHDCGVFVVWTHDIFENMPDRWRAWLCVFADNKWKHFIMATCCRMAAITQCLLFDFWQNN